MEYIAKDPMRKLSELMEIQGILGSLNTVPSLVAVQEWQTWEMRAKSRLAPLGHRRKYEKISTVYVEDASRIVQSFRMFGAILSEIGKNRDIFLTPPMLSFPFLHRFGSGQLRWKARI